MDYFLSEDDAIESATRSDKKVASASATAEKQDGEKKKEMSTSKAKTSLSKATRSESTAKGELLHTPADCRTKPQDPAIPLLSSPDNSHSSTSSQDDYYNWQNLWPHLDMAGWNTIKAGKYNPLHDWYYVRPNRDPGNESCKLGRHYFICQDDVIKFVRRMDKKEGERGGKKKKSRKSVGVMEGAFEEEAKASVRQE